jgi:hypothetical protein
LKVPSPRFLAPSKPGEKPLNKKEVEALLASQSGGYQTVRIETPIKIIGTKVVDPKK